MADRWATMDLAASRRQLLLDSLGIMVSAGGFGLVYGLSAARAPASRRSRPAR